MKILIIGLVSFLFSATSFAGSYYVSTQGSDGNPGSKRLPWRTIQHAADEMTAGDSVMVGTGTYVERVRTRADGTSQNRIILRAQGNAEIKGGFIINHGYISIEGFEITDSGTNVIEVGSNADHLEILNNNIHDFGRYTAINMARGAGTPIKPKGIIIRGNHFHSSESVVSKFIITGGVGHIIESNEVGPGFLVEDFIRPFGDNHIIRNNYIHDIGSGGGHTDVFQVFARNNWRIRNLLFEKNTILNWEGQIFMLSVTSDSSALTIRNNLFFNVQSAGQSYCPQTKVYNNTFVGCGFRNGRVVMIRGAERRGSGANSEVYNNIFYKCGRRDNDGWYKLDDSVKGVQADYNLVYPAKRRFSEHHGINGKDPRFMDERKTDFSLQSGSPCIDAGMKLNGFNDDKNGNIRSGVWDIGAYEYQGMASFSD